MRLKRVISSLLVGVCIFAGSFALAEPVRAKVSVERFYALRDGALAWTGPANRPLFEALLEGLAGASAHGLDPADYHLAELRAADPDEPGPELDRIATDAYLTLAAHLLSGRVDPVSVEPDWTAARRERDLVAYLQSALGTDAVPASLQALAPTQPGYAALMRALARYRAIASRGGWPGVDSGPALRRGDSGPRVEQLRRRLETTGDSAAPDGASEFFDAALEEAVRRFQRRANLEPDGIAGSATLAQLNVPVEARVAQIRANMERWRWLPADLGRRHVRVNIADFRLEARADGAVEREHDVVVGQLFRKTPVFSGVMTYLVLNPWWETPPSLAVKDKLPAFRRNPGTVSALGFQVIDRQGRLVEPSSINWSAVSPASFPYRLRQAPGPQNALGDIKFMFPNAHNVYLHDTPTRGLFAKARRDFSSGCIRVKDPLPLAAWVLQGMPDWDLARIESVAAGEAETRVPLGRSIPVHLLYWTVVQDTGSGSDGSGVRFLPDIYERDARLIAALDG